MPSPVTTTFLSFLMLALAEVYHWAIINILSMHNNIINLNTLIVFKLQKISENEWRSKAYKYFLNNFISLRIV